MISDLHGSLESRYFSKVANERGISHTKWSGTFTTLFMGLIKDSDLSFKVHSKKLLWEVRWPHG